MDMTKKNLSCSYFIFGASPIAISWSRAKFKSDHDAILFFCIWQLHTYTMSKSSGVLRGQSSSLYSHPRWPICRVSLSSSSSLMCQLQFGFRSRDCRRGSPKNKVTARQIVTTCNYLGCVVVSDLAKNAICTKMYYHLSLIPQNWYYLVGSFLKENPLVIGCKKGEEIPYSKILDHWIRLPLFSCHIDPTHLTMIQKRYKYLSIMVKLKWIF